MVDGFLRGFIRVYSYMSEPPDSPPPEDAAFTAALYSRIRGPSPTDSDAASAINSEDDDTMHAQRLSAQHNEYNLTMDFTPKGAVPPPAFVARIRERLQTEMQSNMTTPQTLEHGDDADDQSNTSNTAPDDNTPSNLVVVKPTFHGFLARVETDLAAQYERIVQDDIPLLSSSTNSKWCTEMNALVSSQAETTFKEKHSMTIDDACALAQGMVNELVRGYTQYFDAEKDVLAVAKRYDALQDWVHKSQRLFEDTDLIQPQSLPAFDAMIQQYFHHDDSSTTEHNTTDTNGTDTNVWKKKIQRAKQAWLDIQAQRHIVNRFQAIVGNTHTCKICFTQTVQTVLVPCGHTLCKACAAKVGQCPFCNATFYSAQDVFFA